MIRPIVLYGADVLTKPTKPVTHISDAEIQLVKDMVETMYKAPGVGLAANQVGVGKRIMVTDPSAGEKRNQLITIINPEIVVREGEQTEDEGCLSIPGFSAVVLRPAKVILDSTSTAKKLPLKRKTCWRAPFVTRWIISTECSFWTI